MNSVGDSLSDLASSDSEEDEDGEEDDEEGTEQGMSSEDYKPGWVIGTISQMVEYRMESFWQK